MVGRRLQQHRHHEAFCGAAGVTRRDGSGK